MTKVPPGQRASDEIRHSKGRAFDQACAAFLLADRAKRKFRGGRMPIQVTQTDAGNFVIEIHRGKKIMLSHAEIIELAELLGKLSDRVRRTSGTKSSRAE